MKGVGARPAELQWPEETRVPQILHDGSQAVGGGSEETSPQLWQLCLSSTLAGDAKEENLRGFNFMLFFSKTFAIAF